MKVAVYTAQHEEEREQQSVVCRWINETPSTKKAFNCFFCSWVSRLKVQKMSIRWILLLLGMYGGDIYLGGQWFVVFFMFRKKGRLSKFWKNILVSPKMHLRYHQMDINDKHSQLFAQLQSCSMMCKILWINKYKHLNCVFV